MSSSFVDEIKSPAATSAWLEYPDDVLVAAAKTGDELAFETLIKRHRPRIFAVALRYTRVREDAEDIVQQTLQKAFVYLRKFEGKSSFATWLTRIAINEALMHLRKGRVLREVSLEGSNSAEGTPLNLELVDANPDPEVDYSRREVARIVSSAIRRLRPGMREVLHLREFCELSDRETVKGRAFHGRKQLRRTLRHHMRARRTTAANAAGRASGSRLLN